MRTVLVLLSLSAISILLIDILRLHGSHFTKCVVVYLVAQLFFVFISWRSAAWFGWDSAEYMRAFYFSMGFVSVAAIALSVRFASAVPRQPRLALIEITAAYVIIVCGTFCLALSHRLMLNKFSGAHVLCAGILVFCGALSLSSMAFPSSLVEDILRGFLGFYFLAQGLYGMAEPAMYLRGRAEAVARMSVAPLMITAVIFCSLAIILHSQQKEISRESDAQTSKIHSAALLHVSGFSIASNAQQEARSEAIHG